jgi:hypothetical protein
VNGKVTGLRASANTSGIKQRLARLAGVGHHCRMTAIIRLDPSNRIVLSRKLRRAAGITPRQKLKVSGRPGRIVLEMEANSSGKVIKRGKLKVWTGNVPATPLAQAVEGARRYER